MIQKQQCFVIGDKTFQTFEDAQRYELEQFLKPALPVAEDGELVKEVAGHLLAGKVQVVDILTMSPSARPKARKANGTVRKRSAKPQASPPIAA